MDEKGASVSPGLIKVSAGDADASQKEKAREGESPYRKVAKFLILIGAEEAAKVLSMLSQDQIEKIILEVASIKAVDPDEAADIFAEFDTLAKRASLSTGGLDTARDILTNAFGSDTAAQVIEKAVPISVEKPFSFLEDISPEKLYQLVQDESPAVCAAALSQCSPKLAAGAIALMPEEMKAKTVLQLAKLKELNPDALRRLAASMQAKLKKLAISSTAYVDGPSVLAGILRKMEGSAEKEILDSLNETDPALAKNIGDRLFTMDDILLTPDRFIQEELRKMKDHEIAALIFRKSDEFRRKIFRNISKLRGVSVLEEESACAPFSPAESKEATAAFFDILRNGWEDGLFSIDDGDRGEKWVE